MNLIAAILVIVLPSDSQTVAELFNLLDANSDGKVTRAELSETQRPFFERALRVSDRNEDGALTQAELKAALTEPEPAETSTAGSFGRFARPMMQQFDPKSLDRNNDGNLDASEVPAAMRDRFQKALERFGQTSLPVATVGQYLRSGNGAPRPVQPEQVTAMPPSEMQNINGSALDALFRRLDTDRDGRVTDAEQQRLPGFLKSLDRNRDGQLSGAELAAANRSEPNAVIQPRPFTGTANRRATQLRQSGQYFQRLDADGNGQLSRAEVPQRLRDRFEHADTDRNDSISYREFTQMFQQNAARK